MKRCEDNTGIHLKGIPTKQLNFYLTMFKDQSNLNIRNQVDNHTRTGKFGGIILMLCCISNNCYVLIKQVHFNTLLLIW